MHEARERVMKLDIRKMLLTLAMLCIGGVAQAAGYYGSGYYDNSGYGNNGRVVTCQSQNQRTVYCNIDTQSGVRIYRQLSSGDCIEGSTWGWDGRGVWVSGGCRAEFVVGSSYGNSSYGSSGYGNTGYGNGYYSGNSGYYSRDRDYYGGNSGYNGSSYGYGGSGTFRCESVNSATTYCNVDTRSGVRLMRRLSQANCSEGRTWGLTRQGVWVSNGCRAEFQVGGSSYYGNSSNYNNGYNNNGYYSNGSYSGNYGNTYGYGSGYNQRVTCESRDGRYNFCRTGSYIRQAQIYRKLSSSSCQYNYNWGYRSDGVWVDRGCRAEFVVN
jgi:hypothetical protein